MGPEIDGSLRHQSSGAKLTLSEATRMCDHNDASRGSSTLNIVTGKYELSAPNCGQSSCELFKSSWIS